MKQYILLALAFLLMLSCENKVNKEEQKVSEVEIPFLWENASIYFLLTDRFNNGDPSNDVNFGRTKETAVLRGFEGGDIKGITAKIKDHYFSDLGINAIWFTPVVEQVYGNVDEGTGSTYGYHGYWAKDWTALDPNFGTEEDLAELVAAAHEHGIRVVFDVVINHTGPVTEKDPVWGDSWVRTEPTCTYQDYVTTVECTLVKNLPDIRTDSDEPVELPQELLDKWEAEGRLQQELDELDAFFERTGYPRAPRFYIMKWITDYVRKYGIDAFRVDTAKHTEAGIWAELYKEAVIAFADWKAANANDVLDDSEFYMFGEVYNYAISSGRDFDYGDRKVDFFDNGFKSLINFDFKWDAKNDYESIFVKYDTMLHGELKGKTVVNYLSSHDDGAPFDQQREKALESGTKLLLCPGSPQIYYGDETSRELVAEGAEGDANLRTFMNWEELQNNAKRGGVNVQAVLEHWQKLGKFRAKHPSVGAGRHQMLSEAPYVFSRSLALEGYTDQVVVGLDFPIGPKSVDVSSVFADGMEITDHYSGSTAKVANGIIEIDTAFPILLLGS